MSSIWPACIWLLTETSFAALTRNYPRDWCLPAIMCTQLRSPLETSQHYIVLQGLIKGTSQHYHIEGFKGISQHYCVAKFKETSQHYRISRFYGALFVPPLCRQTTSLSDSGCKTFPAWPKPLERGQLTRVWIVQMRFNHVEIFLESRSISHSCICIKVYVHLYMYIY